MQALFIICLSLYKYYNDLTFFNIILKRPAVQKIAI